ncbi:MAG TPA: hypothetical protein VKD23_03160 [Terriglobales bacterium]|nr:hypothetical protein [Terriglobales bacterium]
MGLRMHELRGKSAHHEYRTGRNPNLTLPRDEFGGIEKIELLGVSVVFMGLPIIGEALGSLHQFN